MAPTVYNNFRNRRTAHAVVYRANDKMSFERQLYAPSAKAGNRFTMSVDFDSHPAHFYLFGKYNNRNTFITLICVFFHSYNQIPRTRYKLGMGKGVFDVTAVILKTNFSFFSFHNSPHNLLGGTHEMLDIDLNVGC